MNARARGERESVRRLSCPAARIKIAQAVTTNRDTNFIESAPAGIARVAVRGLAASIWASASRLKAMAADRAETMHTTIQINSRPEGTPPAASMAPHRAKGRAKMECSHLIISRVVPMLVRNCTGYFKQKSKASPRRLGGTEFPPALAVNIPGHVDIRVTRNVPHQSPA